MSYDDNYRVNHGSCRNAPFVRIVWEIKIAEVEGDIKPEDPDYADVDSRTEYEINIDSDPFRHLYQNSLFGCGACGYLFNEREVREKLESGSIAEESELNAEKPTPVDKPMAVYEGTIRMQADGRIKNVPNRPTNCKECKDSLDDEVGGLIMMGSDAICSVCWEKYAQPGSKPVRTPV